jgi:hypothetical protein
VCDGEYVACRPSGFHAGSHERHQRFLNSGHYKHVGTFDDVQVYELLPGSPFRRDNRTFTPGRSLWGDIRAASIAAVKHDWVLFHDILEVIAGGLKQKYGPNVGHQMYQEILERIFVATAQRGGPPEIVCTEGLQMVRMKRGLGSGKQILLPA